VYIWLNSRPRCTLGHICVFIMQVNIMQVNIMQANIMQVNIRQVNIMPDKMRQI